MKTAGDAVLPPTALPTCRLTTFRTWLIFLFIPPHRGARCRDAGRRGAGCGACGCGVDVALDLREAEGRRPPLLRAAAATEAGRVR